MNETVKHFFRKNFCFLMSSIKQSCDKLTRGKPFFVTKFLCGNISMYVYPQGSFVLISFYGGLLSIS